MTKQRNKKKLLPKPRAKAVHEVLVAKVGGAHEPKTGPKAKRAKQKAVARKEILDI